ncbi:MAG: hypothetical protein ACERK1_11400, partial [Anaerolineales bacterium]
MRLISIANAGESLADLVSYYYWTAIHLVVVSSFLKDIASVGPNSFKNNVKLGQSGPSEHTTFISSSACNSCKSYPMSQ